MNGVRLLCAIAGQWPSTLLNSSACRQPGWSAISRRHGNAMAQIILADTHDIPSFDMTLWR
ncbi:hypothetical protein EMIT0P44_100028 [Pseudomonas sp. IT-P44]